MDQDYKAPEIRALGSVKDLTEQRQLGGDKVGASNDTFTALTSLDGKIIPDV